MARIATYREFSPGHRTEHIGSVVLLSVRQPKGNEMTMTDETTELVTDTVRAASWRQMCRYADRAAERRQSRS